jgi:hypothetical protein
MHRATKGLGRIIKRYCAYEKKLKAKANHRLYPAIEQEVRRLQRNRSSLSEEKVLRALERDYYTCTNCGRMQIWILDDRKERSNRLYKQYGFSYYSRPSIILDIHHIVPVPFGDDDPDNLATVCRECHRMITVELCIYQAKLFEEFGRIYVDRNTRIKIDRITLS